jgi:hypothetical protein
MRNLKPIFLTLIILVNAIVSFAQLNTVENLNACNEVHLAIKKYVTVYPNEAYGHLYGKKALREMLSINGTEKIYVFNAMLGTSMKIVFKVSDKNGNILSHATAYDHAKTCPPKCPTNTTNGGKTVSIIGSPIEEGLAQQMILNFQDNHRSRAKAQLFERESFEQVLAQDGAEGMFFCSGINTKGEQTMIAVGVDANENLMWDGVVLNNGVSIPSFQYLPYPERNVIAKK